MEQNTVSQYDDDLTVGMEETEDYLDTGFVDLFEQSSNNGSPISRLKTIVLSIDWEINDEVLTQFNDELLALKDVWTGDQVKLVYVQALEKISKYIYQFRADAHPNAIKLLLTFYYNLEKIVLGTDLNEVEIKEILREDIKKFEHLKHQIGAVSVADKPESSPEGETTSSPPGASEPHPILFNLKASILGMDWEITERELADLGKEVGRLEEEFAGRKPQMIFLQGIGALGGYIKLKKSDAHADAFKLLYSFYEGLEKIVINPDLSKDEVKEILLPEVEKFEDFKQIIASTITPEAIAEKTVNDQRSVYGEGDSEAVAPAFSDVPDEVKGFQAEEEAATLGSAPDDVDSRLDNFFSGEKTPEQSIDTSGVLPPDAIEKIDSFFGDDLVDDALSVSSISAEDALKGVDVETEADDDSDEEALPTQGDGMIAPALAESAEAEPHGFNPDISTEESLYAATDVDDSIDNIFAEDVADKVVTQAAALQGVDVETEADDDSDEQPLPTENEDIAPALALEDPASESAEHFQAEAEIGDIDAHIQGFFGDDTEDDEPDLGTSAFKESGGDEVSAVKESSEELPGGIEERLDAFFPEPDDDTEDDVFSAALEEDGALAAGESPGGLLSIEEQTDETASTLTGSSDGKVIFEAIEAADTPIAAEEVPLGLLDEEIEAEVAADEEDLLESEAEMFADEEVVAESEAEMFADEEVVADGEAEVAADEEDALESEAEALADEAIEPEPEADLAADDETYPDLDREAVSSFGSDSDEKDFFAAIDDRIDEPGEFQIELLSEPDKLESELVTDLDEIDAAGVIQDQEQERIDAGLTEAVSEQPGSEAEVLLFAVDDELSELRAGVASLGVEINDSITEGLFTEINRLRHRMMTKPVEKTFLQLLSTVVQHIGHYKYESSSEAHTLVLSVFDKLELSQKKDTSQEQSQEILLAETCKVLLWQQKMLDRQAVKKGGELTFPDPIRAEPSEEAEEDSIGDEFEAAVVADSGTQDISEQSFSAVFEPVDDHQDIAAYEEIEAAQEELEHELGDTFIEGEPQPVDGGVKASGTVSPGDPLLQEQENVPGKDNLPEIVREDEKRDFKGLSSLLTNVVKREMKALKDFLQSELKALKDKLKDKD